MDAEMQRFFQQPCQPCRQKRQHCSSCAAVYIVSRLLKLLTRRAAKLSCYSGKPSADVLQTILSRDVDLLVAGIAMTEALIEEPQAIRKASADTKSSWLDFGEARHTFVNDTFVQRTLYLVV